MKFSVTVDGLGRLYLGQLDAEQLEVITAMVRASRRGAAVSIAMIDDSTGEDSLVTRWTAVRTNRSTRA